MDKPGDGDGNDRWILWRLGQVEKAIDGCTKSLGDLAVMREKIDSVARRMDQQDTRQAGVGRALWGLAATIIAALVVFVLTGVH